MRTPQIPKRARSILFWTILAFFVFQMAFVVVVDWWFPYFYDTESAQRLRDLRAHMQAEPKRPLLLLLGSSRTSMNFRPEIVGDLLPGQGPQPLVYNFSHLGGTPSFSLLQLERLIKHGVKPRWVAVEVMTPLLSRDATGLLAMVAVTPELPMLVRHSTAKRMLRNYLFARVIPWHKNRTNLLMDLAPGWVAEGRLRARDQEQLGSLGWDNRFWKYIKNAHDRELQFEQAHSDYGPNLQAFQIKEWLTRCFDDLADLCRREHIGLALVMTPESTAFRSWYAPGAEAQGIQHFCADLTRRKGVPVIDGRGWVPDAEFYDGHHVLPRGADTFTRRLEQDVFRPLVRGQLESETANPSSGS